MPIRNFTKLPTKNGDNRISPSLDQTFLNLIEHAERMGALKLSASRFTNVSTSTHKRVYEPNELLRADAAASLLRISPKTLANWRVKGAGPQFVKSGGAVTYRYCDLQEFIIAQTRQSTSDVGGSHG